MPLAALQALRDKAGLAAGGHVLVNDASGGVGTFVVQISRAMGARMTAVVSGRSAGFVRDLGADEVLDYTREDVTAGGCATTPSSMRRTFSRFGRPAGCCARTGFSSP